MFGKPKAIYILLLLWLVISGIFIMWGAYSLYIVKDIPEWTEAAEGGLSVELVSILHFGFLTSTILWFVFSFIFIIFFYGTVKADTWVWTTGLIISTIFMAIFALMLASFMVNAIMFRTTFSVLGLVTVVLSFLTNLGIIFHLTRPATKKYFHEEK
jgi:hypothetical protein